jgi:hypothetical protein
MKRYDKIGIGIVCLMFLSMISIWACGLEEAADQKYKDSLIVNRRKPGGYRWIYGRPDTILVSKGDTILFNDTYIIGK